MKVVIIGGGASGLMAAITAAENGHSVTVLERQARVGRKLSATGNGRCNLSNIHADITRYHGENTKFMLPAMEELNPGRAIELFRSLGLVTVTEPDGKVYPFSDQAGSVVDILRFSCDGLGVNTVTGAEVTAVKKSGGGFKVVTDGESYTCDRVIVCCGGCAGGKLGGTMSGYELLSSLGHRRTKLYPALVQLKTETEFVKSLKGVRADAAVTLKKGGAVLAQSAGEVQFTEYGLSGPAIFEVSRAASVSGEGTAVTLDLMRGLSESETLDFIFTRKYTHPELTNENLLTGMLHNRLGRTVIRACGLDLNASVEALSDRDAGRIGRTVKDFRLKVTGTTGFDGAQVTAGGMDTGEFDPKTLESRIVKGLYAAGEVLDIDGDCGGFNLQWAWASGRLAGQLR